MADLGTSYKEWIAEKNETIRKLTEERDQLKEEIKRLQGKWIPVMEQLPEEDEEVLVLFGNSCSVMRITNADKQDVWHWDGSYNMVWSNFNDTVHADICEATHWMPLPEPPKEGRTKA